MKNTILYRFNEFTNIKSALTSTTSSGKSKLKKVNLITRNLYTK